MFSFVYDPKADVLRISVEGLWGPEDVPPLHAALISAARRASEICEDFNILVESFDFPLQNDDVADALAGIAQTGMALTTGYAAIVVGSEENYEQASRTLAHPRLSVFRTMEAAREWLSRQRVLNRLTRLQGGNVVGGEA